MCADDENSSTTNILLPVVIIFLILVIAVVWVIITLLVRWKKRERHIQVHSDHEEHIYDMPHFAFPPDSSNSATKCDDEKPNMAYGKVNILET